ncbi:MAG: hypothetical protein GF315_14370 [candidate division Zixibacteria bacterium]|nr:hypothetical protein [candidate division Zixibacteria bacterium]
MAKGKDKKSLLKIKIGDQVKEVSYEELALSNNLATEALVAILVEKGIIDPEEYLKKMQNVRKERYRDESEF